MPRIRSLKPEFFDDEELCRLPPLARLLFAGLWCWADREGRLKDQPARLKQLILGYDRCDPDKLLDQLAGMRLISRYEVDGKHYIEIRNFHKHQRPHPNEMPSSYPGFAPNSESLAPNSESLAPKSRTNRGEGEGKEGIGTDPDPAGEPLIAVAVLPVTVAQVVHAIAAQPNFIGRASKAWERQSPGGVSAGVAQILQAWLVEGVRIEYIEAACEAAREAGCHKPPKYVEAIIRRYQAQGSTEDQRGRRTSQGNGAVRQGDARHLGASQRVPGVGVDWEQEARDNDELNRLAGKVPRDPGLSEDEVG